MYQVGYDKERKFWWYCYVGADRVFVFVIVECEGWTSIAMFLQWELIDFLSKTSGGKCFEVGRSYVTSSKLMVSGKLIS